MEVVKPTSTHTHTVINLHGRDSNASDYCNEFFESEDSSGKTLLAAFPTIKWVFPTAPQILSQRFQRSMSQWFDMWSTNNPHERNSEQTQHLQESVSSIAKLVKSEAKVIGMDNVILCGISQGAALALAMVLELETPICAYIGISTWLPSYYKTPPSCKTPMFLAHCQDDDVIEIENSDALKKRMEQLQIPIEFHRYTEGGHWINEPQGVDDIEDFLRRFVK